MRVFYNDAITVPLNRNIFHREEINTTHFYEEQVSSVSIYEYLYTLSLNRTDMRRDSPFVY